MMTPGEIQEKAAQLIEFYRQRFALDRWRITLEVGLPGNPHRTYAEVTASYERQQAHLVVNPVAFEDEESLRQTIRHEMLHLVVSPIDLLLKNNSPEVHQFVEECIIRALENMCDEMEGEYGPDAEQG